MHTTFFFVLLVYYVFSTVLSTVPTRIHETSTLVTHRASARRSVTTIYNHVTKRERNHTNRETRRQQVKREVMKCWRMLRGTNIRKKVGQ
jgi:hypothetical protein